MEDLEYGSDNKKIKINVHLAVLPFAIVDASNFASNHDTATFTEDALLVQSLEASIALLTLFRVFPCALH